VQERWLVQQRKALADAVADVDALQSTKEAGEGGSQGRQELSKELEARVKLLEDHAEGYKDTGPMLHCVVWHDGDVWRAAVDTSDFYAEKSGEGLLADFTPLTNFRRASKCVCFKVRDYMFVYINMFM
jgi:tripeptidyl-peptidase II